MNPGEMPCDPIIELWETAMRELVRRAVTGDPAATATVARLTGRTVAQVNDLIEAEIRHRYEELTGDTDEGLADDPSEGLPEGGREADGSGVSQGFTEGFTGEGPRGSRAGGRFLGDKGDLSNRGDQQVDEGHEEASGVHEGPDVNPS